jgi:hypothetical protein
LVVVMPFSFAQEALRELLLRAWQTSISIRHGQRATLLIICIARYCTAVQRVTSS